MTFLPIVGRELSVASRKWGTYWLRPASVLLVLVVWFFLLANTPRDQGGIVLLISTSVLAFAYALFAGALRTADCLSEEKREGTIGLLFLTDLKAYDVVLGKLVASSLNTFFILLAVLPVLWLSVLVGGVTGKEFLRIVLVLIATMFFSLGIGMFASAVSREAKQAFGLAFVLIVIICGMCPALWWLQNVTPFAASRGRGLDLLMIPSPAFALFKAFERFYGFSPTDYWMSLGVVFGMGLTGIVLATIILPRVWQDKGRVPKKKTAGPSMIRCDALAVKLRSRWLDWNPMYWLAARSTAPQRSIRWVLVVMVPICLLGMVGSYFGKTMAHVPFIVAMIAAFATHLAVKVFIATEASRRFNQDRRSGALELLLVTPLRVDLILAGQKRALRHHFKKAIVILCLVNLALCLVVMTNARDLQIRSRDFWIFMGLFLGGLVMLLIDFATIGWVAMWQGLKGKPHLRAVAATIGLVKGPTWLFLFLVIFAQPRRVETVFSLLFVAGAINSVVVGLFARFRIKRRFRAVASGRDRAPAARDLPARRPTVTQLSFGTR